MKFDYHAYPIIDRMHADGFEITYGRMARVTVNGINVYIDAQRAWGYGLNYAEPEEIPEFLTQCHMDVQRDNGYGFYVYVTDIAHFALIGPALSLVEGIAFARAYDPNGPYRRWENGVLVSK